ncbi:LysR family transcriptional regulator [Gynuella sunshinyii]|uniref:Transcriptional regulator n=1 Tax=Gynuella sunshinyii YC6258 TaxID=1445510 RepID=A0A0C5VAG6_9GAMM|nr:LysR family transcriptional regulator [Gynuella sunshinyii]AJQ96310.1 transcriptional regulator [Gynuella sunshinyii YC6258]
MNIKAIAALSAVAKYGSYTAAANALECSKAYLSEQVKLLEDSYDIQLVLRTTRKVSLTPAGKEFIGRCNAAFAQIQEAEDQLLTEQTQLSGLIRIASIGGIMGEELIAPAIYQFMTSHPKVEIELNFSSQNVDLLSGDYDLAVRLGELKDSTLIARRLLSYRLLLVASPDYLETFTEPHRPQELNSHRLITGTISQWEFIKGRQKETLTPYPVLHCGNGKVMLNAALNGHGITRLPSIYVEPFITSGQLISVLPEWTEKTLQCHILYPPGRYRLLRVQKLVEHMLETIPQLIE